MLGSISTQAKTIKVFVPDTGVDISHLEIRNHVNMMNWEKEDYIDVLGHGTHIAGLILKDTCPEVELVSCKYFSPLQDNLLPSINCFKKALTVNPTVINYSSGGSKPSPEEFEVLKQLSDMGVKIVVAAGNDGFDLNDENNNYYPAKYSGIANLIVVGNLHNKLSNFGLSNMVWEYGTNVYSTLPESYFGNMTGTSQSAAIYTNKLLKMYCKDLK